MDPVLSHAAFWIRYRYNAILSLLFRDSDRVGNPNIIDGWHEKCTKLAYIVMSKFSVAISSSRETGNSIWSQYKILNYWNAENFWSYKLLRGSHMYMNTITIWTSVSRILNTNFSRALCMTLIHAFTVLYFNYRMIYGKFHTYYFNTERSEWIHVTSKYCIWTNYNELSLLSRIVKVFKETTASAQFTVKLKCGVLAFPIKAVRWRRIVYSYETFHMFHLTMTTKPRHALASALSFINEKVSRVFDW
jgi:hypothetical protein